MTRCLILKLTEKWTKNKTGSARSPFGFLFVIVCDFLNTTTKNKSCWIHNWINSMMAKLLIIIHRREGGPVWEFYWNRFWGKMFALFLMADFFVAMDTANISLTFSPRTYFKITEGNSQTGPPSLRWIIIRSLAIMVETDLYWFKV